MLTLSAGTIVLVSLGAFIGAVSAGAAGFAFAMTASAIWLHVMDPVRSALLVVASGGLLHAILVWRMLDHRPRAACPHPARLARLLRRRRGLPHRPRF